MTSFKVSKSNTVLSIDLIALNGGLTCLGNTTVISLQKVLLKEVPELSNYIDRSQLTAQLGGYLVYGHQSWVAFIKVISHGNIHPFCLQFENSLFF